MSEDIKNISTSELENCSKLEAYLLTLANLCKDASDELVEAESKYKYLENLEDLVFDTELPEAGPDKISIPDRQKIARTSTNYRNHIDGMAEARKDFLKAKYKYENLVRKHDDVQSILLKRFGSSR